MKLSWKKWILAFLVVFLTGCTGKGEKTEEVFSVGAEQREVYEKAIANTLDSFYWKYDSASIAYFEETVPNKSDQANQEFFEANLDSGFSLEKYAGKTAVVSTVNLIHFNGDSAGTAYFYFLKDDPIGVYYRSDLTPGRCYSLKSRNIYLENMDFETYETQTSIANFDEKSSNFNVDGFSSFGVNDKGECLLAAISGKSVLVYRYKNGFSLLKRINFVEDENLPMSASFYRQDGETGDRLAVLLGNFVYNEQDSLDASGYYLSNKVMFFDQNLIQLQEELLLGETGYTCVSNDEGHLIFINGQMIEYQEKDGEIWKKVEQYKIKNGVIGFLTVDLDGDGQNEYLMTDGMDFFVYTKNERGFRNIWKTHLSIESLEGNIYAGDLNQDGVKEIYISDKTGTMIRYVLTKNGLVSRNEDIDYGQRFYVCDFDKDGKDDYIKINDAENNNQRLYLAK